MNIEIVMQEEHPNRRLNPSDSYGRDSFSSQSTSMQGEESFLPKGNKLFGCMFIFFLFSGGFIGSFFALDALEEPEPNSFNAQLGVYPGACVDDESGCNKLAGLITVSKPELCETPCKTQTLKLQANGLKKNLNISRISIHDGISCTSASDIGSEWFIQGQTKIYNTSAAEGDWQGVLAVLKIDDTFAEDKIKFHHLYAAPLYGDNGRLPSVMVKSDYTCTPSSGEFGHDIEVIPPTMYDLNITGSLTFSTRTGGGFTASYAFDSTTSPKAITMTKVRILEATNCDNPRKDDPALLELTIPSYSAFEAEGTHTFNPSNSPQLPELRGHAAVVVDSDGLVSSCGLIAKSPYIGMNLTKTEGSDIVELDLGYTMDNLRSRACIVSKSDSTILGCGLIADSPYKHESFNFEDSEIKDETGSYKRVSTEVEIETGHDFYTFEGKIGILEDADGGRIGCGVLNSAS